MRRIAASIAALSAALISACASAGAPPGGPEDHAPPQILSVSPDSGETNVKIRSVEFRFDEVVNEQPSGVAGNLDQIFLISPRNGAAQVSWRRKRVTVRPRNGFRPNTAYRVTLLPGLADLRGNVRKETTTILFSTGPGFPPYGIVGTVFDWAAERPAAGAYVEAILRSDTSLAYISATDTTGKFDLGPLDAGTYLVRAIIDQNRNRVADRGEKWDTTTVVVTDSRPSIELDVIERDSLPPAIDAVTPLDSVTLRLTFDKALDPKMSLEPSMVRIQRADSSQLTVTRIEWQSTYERAIQVRDSTRRADSLRAVARADSARADSARARGDTLGAARQPPPPPATARPFPVGQRGAPPPPKPSAPPPNRGVVIILSPNTPLRPNTTYHITARGFRNLLGNSAQVSRPFTTPRPAPPPDTTSRRPPPRPPR